MPVVPLSSARSPGRHGASNEQTRRHNLSIVLTALHQHGAQPRANLTARSGLNRSTTAALVAELAARGLVFETDPGKAGQVGRPSPTVHPDPSNVAFAVNPEVDAITVGVVALGGRVVRRVRHPTTQTASVDEAIQIIVAIIERLRIELGASVRVAGIGVAIPGLVRSGDGVVRFAPHLGWRDAPFAQLLADATGERVAVGNDASLGAVAEKIFGAGRGMSDIVYLNGGASGIGGGVIAGGTLLRGAGGYAGEFGHIRVVGGAASRDRAEEGSLEAAVNRADLLRALCLETADADELDGALAASTDSAVIALVRRQLDYLSIALRNAVNVLNPQVVVLGGFLASIFQVDPAYLRERVAEQSLAPAVECVTITCALLGSDLLMIGAAELAFAGLLSDPVGTIGR